MPIRPTRPAARRRLAGIASGAVALGVLLTGCVGAPAPTSSPAPETTPAPVFASDEEALAAAEAAYLAYSVVIDAIADDGNRGADRIRDVVTESYAPQIEKMFGELAQRGLTISGDTVVDSFRLIESAQVDGRAEVTILLCSDVTRSRILDSTGNDVTPTDRPDRSALQAVVVSSGDVPTELVVDKEDPWSGDYC